MTGIPRKTFEVLQNFGILQAFESARFGILQKLLLSFLEMLKFLGTQLSVVHRGEGGGWIFSGTAHCHLLLSMLDTFRESHSCSTDTCTRINFSPAISTLTSDLLESSQLHEAPRVLPVLENYQ